MAHAIGLVAVTQGVSRSGRTAGLASIWAATPRSAASMPRSRRAAATRSTRTCWRREGRLSRRVWRRQAGGRAPDPRLRQRLGHRQVSVNQASSRLASILVDGGGFHQRGTRGERAGKSDREDSRRSTQPSWGANPPKDLVDAFHSLEYYLACAAADKDFNWVHASAAKFQDPAITRLMKLVELRRRRSPSSTSGAGEARSRL